MAPEVLDFEVMPLRQILAAYGSTSLLFTLICVAPPPTEDDGSVLMKLCVNARTLRPTAGPHVAMSMAPGP